MEILMENSIPCTLSKFLIIEIFEILTSQKFIHYNQNVDFKIFTHKIFTFFLKL